MDIFEIMIYIEITLFRYQNMQCAFTCSKDNVSLDKSLSWKKY